MKLGGSLERTRGRGRWLRPRGDDGSLFPRIERDFAIKVGALVLGGWIAGYLLSTRVLFPAPPPPRDLIEVPDVRGVGVEAAADLLQRSGLVLGGVDSLLHPSVPEASIMGQSPLPGQVAHPNAEVRVTVSLGPQRRSVPDVLGLNEDRARIVLETSGFLVDADSGESEEPRGRIIEVSPPPGQQVVLPGRVRLTVSIGPPVINMPLVLGLEEAAAVTMLDSLGLIVTEVEEVFRFGRDQGIVVEQEPASDTELQRGSSVRLKVGRRGLDSGNND